MKQKTNIQFSIRSHSALLVAGVLAFAMLFGSSSTEAATGAPNIISYQGRLTNGSGQLLGGSGTNYTFKFSIWDNATVGNPTKLWPAGSPTAYTTTVTD